jgi:hypothetical protein
MHTTWRCLKLLEKHLPSENKLHGNDIWLSFNDARYNIALIKR